MDDSLSRRDFLAGAGTASVMSLTGCIGPFSDSKNSTGEPFSHVGLKDYKNQPRLGNEITSDQPFVLALEDLSCPSCKAFHENTLPDLRNYIDSGELSMIFRFGSVIRPWADTAAKVQEAIYERGGNEDATEIISEYYSNQSRITSSNAVDISEELVNKINMNGSEVVSSVNEGEYEGEHEKDNTALRESDVTGTPTFILFDGGIKQSRIVGIKPASVFTGALDL